MDDRGSHRLRVLLRVRDTCRLSAGHAAVWDSPRARANAAAVTDHLLFWIAGFIVGGGTAGMVGKGFVEERGRRLIPLFVALALVCGLIVGWALNAWVDYIHFTGNGGGGMGG